MSEPLPLNDLVEFTKSEQQQLREMNLTSELQTPSESVVDRILNYSRALTVNKSKHGDFFFVNN